MGMGGQRHTLGKYPVPIVKEAGWIPEMFWTVRKMSPPPEGFDLRIVHPAASRYTDCACGKVVTHVVNLDAEVCKFSRIPMVLCYHMR